MKRRRGDRRRSLRLEPLARRELLAADLQNPYEPLDVNQDLKVSSLDALWVINYLGIIGQPSLDDGMLDVDGNGDVTPSDALRVMNHLGDDHQISVMRLANDTGPGGIPNYDGLTADLTVEGKIVWPDSTPPAYRTPFLAAKREDGQYLYKSLSEYLQGDYFQIPSNDVLSALSLAIDNDTNELRVELQDSRVEFGAPGVPLAAILVRFDPSRPRVKLPDWISSDAQTIRITINDDSPVAGLSRDPNKASGIRFSIDGQTVDHLWEPTAGPHGIDVAISQVAAGLEDVVTIDIDAIIEDLAGNQITLPTQILLQRSRPNLVLDSYVPGPVLGTAFFDDGITGNPNGLIRLPERPIDASTRIYVPVVETVDGAGRKVNWETGPFQPVVTERVSHSQHRELIYRLPTGATSGPIKNDLGEVIADLHVVPNAPQVSVGNGVWELPPNPGGLHPDELSYRYRFLDDEESASDVMSEDVAAWPQIISGQPAPAFGFQPIQVAGEGGVSEPYNLTSAHPNLGTIRSLLADPDGEHLWLGLYGRLVKIDVATAQVVDEIPVVGSTLGEMPVNNLQWIDAETIAPAVEFFDGQPASQSGPWMLYADGARQIFVADPANLKVIGELPYPELQSLFAVHSEAITPIFHPQLETWFAISPDERYLREYSLTGQLVREQLAIGGHTWRSHSPLPDGLLVWDHVREQMVLLRDFDNYVFDPVTYSFSQTSQYPELDINPADRVVTDVTVDSSGDVLFSRTTGIVQRLAIEEAPVTGQPVITEIIGVAEMGDPADPNLPSANPGQLIEVRGENLNAGGFRLEFPYRYVNRSIRYEGIRSDAPILVSDDGRAAWFNVHDWVFTGPVKVGGSSDQTGLPLQIVPAVRDDDVIGVGIDEFQLLIDGEIVNHCADWTEASRGCGTLLSGEFLPEPRSSKEYITVGGATIRLVADHLVLTGDKWQVSSLISSQPVYGKDFVFDLPADQWVPASSELVIEVAAKPGYEHEPLPEWLNFAFVSETADGIRRYQRASGKIVDGTSQYLVWAPVDFPGGKVMVQHARPADGSIEIEIAPTVIGASGDSALPGSAILLAGVGLREAEFFIDDLEATATDLPSFADVSFDLVRLEVPAGVTSGRLRIERDEVTATLDRLSPWWLDGEMPVAAGSVPTFADLPSVNVDQAFTFVADAPLDDFHVRYLNVSRGSTLSPRGHSHTNVAELDDQRIAIEIKPRVADSVFLFQEESNSLWSIVPIVPSLPEMFEIPKAYTDSIAVIGFDLAGLEAINNISVDWGDQSWPTSFQQRYSIGNRIDGRWFFNRHFQNSDQSPQSQISINHPAFIDPLIRQDVNVAFDQQVFKSLPEGPIRFSSPWGYADVGVISEEDRLALDTFAANLRADTGTPADPDQPSVNPGQLIDLPGEFVDKLTAAYFAYEKTDGDEPVLEWSGSLVEEARIRVPYDALTGSVRMGLFASDVPIQILPAIEPGFTNPQEGVSYRLYGVDEQSILRIGEKEFPLTESEIEKGEVIVSLLDPRFSDLTRDDFALGLSVISRGGQSALLYPKMISRIVPPTPSLFPGEDPSIPAVAPWQVVRIEGHQLVEDEFIDIGFTGGRLFDVSPDGRTAKFQIPSNAVNDNAIVDLVYRDADYWPLEPLPINIIVKPDVAFGPINIVAAEGQPADPSKPSANPGQYISFEVTPGSPDGYAVEYPVFNTVTGQEETYYRTTTSPRGLPQIRAVTLLYGTGTLIPISGTIQLVPVRSGFGQNEPYEGAEIEYQLVPTIWNIHDVSASEVRVTVRGAHAGNAEVYWEDQLVYSFDPTAVLSDIATATWTNSQTIQLVFAEGASTSGTLRVQTSGGSHQRSHKATS